MLKGGDTVTEKEKEIRERDKQDARNLAEFIKSNRTPDQSLGVALSSYMTGYNNGLFDAFKRFNFNQAAVS